jgi:branched-chain amino acid transport system substrate-binding protein
MISRSISPTRTLLAGLFTVSLVLAACGSDGDSTSEPAASGDTSAAPADTAAPSDTEGASSDTAAPSDTADAAPIEAPTGEPFRIGVQNLEGDPNGSFPEYSLAIQAAADYVNAELGGLGGRPIEIVLCKSIVSPDDSQRCANELSAEGVDLAISTINFFGNHYAIYQGSGIPVIAVTPITIADFTSEGVRSIGAGGGCLGVHTGLVQFATAEIEDELGIDVQKVGVPWADTPPGVVCYNDLEAKPLDVINGKEPGDAARAGEKPDLTYIGVPIAPATPDATPQATEVLDFDPDVIIFSAQGADCWNFVDSLGRLGWTPESVPLVLSGSCTDFEAMRAAGPLAEGVFFIGSGNTLLSPLEGQEPGKNLDDATVYQEKSAEYGLSQDDVFKGFATQGFSAIMNIWDVSQGLDEVTGEAIDEALGATDGSLNTFGGAPLDCAGAPTPYIAVCSSAVSVNVWDGEKFVPVVPELNGLDLVAGTALRPGS